MATLARADTVTELLDLAHLLWCGPDCAGDQHCTFLHYSRSSPAPAMPRAVRSRYNKDTADLFLLMGGDGYTPQTSQAHEIEFWSLLRSAVNLLDRDTPARLHYTDWSKKSAHTASELVVHSCRDTIQWMANWCGACFADQPTALHYVAFSVVCDDLCIPPLDLVHGHFRMYDRSVAALATALDTEGWGHDGVHVLLSLVRQYILQYVEKLTSEVHDQLNLGRNIWDALVYRTHTANTFGAVIAVARLSKTGPATQTWLMDSSICDAISMDLCKSALDVYQHDHHRPTAHRTSERHRRTAYHSIYLDLIDDLVSSGAPEPLVHFGRAGFLYVQLQERYQERRTGRRMALRQSILSRLHHLFGDANPTTSHTEDAFRAAQDTPLPAHTEFSSG
ncbi:hypothetical protein ACFFQW_38410 [Umezawaea endophytica]|uniref:Uncharacterized protein n=1 Tax=Umezawaea endophytica TaxID=1654476 RepID=A0A9X2VX85_9PSEU|nr:hypothetical protein [Umezawaea endophytica]MCS7483817.1 hypothetical protein [Umezawaea endophytica]